MAFLGGGKGTRRIRVGDTVKTPRGVGEISHVFPRGPRALETYAVRFVDRKVALVFSRDEVTVVGEK